MEELVGLENLREYRYRCSDKSILSRLVLNRFYNWAVNFFPMWMAPNLITLVGLCSQLAMVGLACFLFPSLTGRIPSWFCYAAAASLFFYATLDSVDGRQARRTGSSSALGEFFDHGCDSLNTSLSALIYSAILGLGHSARTLFLFAVANVCFLVSTWEHYHTGVLYFGYISAVSEGIVSTCLLLVSIGYFGAAGIWTTGVIADYPLVARYLPLAVSQHYQLADLFLALLAVFQLAFCSTFSFLNVYWHFREKGTVSSFPRVCIQQLLPTGGFLVSLFYWCSQPNSVLMRDDSSAFLLFLVGVGLVFSKFIGCIILSHLLLQPLSSISVGMVLYSVIGCMFAGSKWEPYVVAALLGYALVDYASWFSTVTGEFCRFLGISLLSIPCKKAKN